MMYDIINQGNKKFAYFNPMCFMKIIQTQLLMNHFKPVI